MIEVSLSARNIVKRYGGVVALADGNLEVRSGEVVALVGANGSGKSTLGKIITGVAAADSGVLLVDGRPVHFASPLMARRMGITAVYQELSLVPDMTVAENVWLGHEPLRRIGTVDGHSMERQTEALIDLFAGTVRPSLRPGTLVHKLPPDERQIVEILKALSQQPRLVILDEATSSLDNRQVTRLFKLVEDWKERGMGVVVISHRMEEIFRVADRATVMRSGDTVADVVLADTNASQLVEWMIPTTGAPSPREKATVTESGQLRLQVQHLTTGRLQDVSFSVQDGALLGIGGLRGQGQEELLLALFGAVPYSGKVWLSGELVHFTHPRQAVRRDLGFVPGDRATEGLLLSRSILENLQLPSWRRYGIPLEIGRAWHDGEQMSEQLGLVMDSLDSPVSTLSGGNAQKVVLGKWLLRDPRLLLLNDPTKGVDVGAKREFYRLLDRLREAGTAILFYSSDDEELLNLCDRVLVLHDGRISGELTADSLTHANLVAASLGQIEMETV